MLYLFLSASAYTNKLGSLENRVEQLQEELNELKLERGNSVQSVFDKFDADESNSLSMSEFKSMVTAGAVSLAADEERDGCAGCTCKSRYRWKGSEGTYTSCDCTETSTCSGSNLEVCLRADMMKSHKPCDPTSDPSRPSWSKWH